MIRGVHGVCMFLLLTFACTQPCGSVKDGPVCVTDSGTNGDSSANGDSSGGDSDTDTDTDADTDTYTSEYTVCDDGTAPFTTIQAAVDAASARDTIKLCPGTYDEKVTISAFNLSIKGAGMDTTTLASTSGTSLTTDGVTVYVTDMNLGGVGGASTGAAVNATNSSVELDRVRATGLTGGYGFYGNNSTFTIDYSYIEDSTLGAVIDQDHGGGLIVFQTVIRRNAPSGSSAGGQLVQVNDASVQLYNSIVYDNTFSTPTGFYLNGGTQIIWFYNDVIANNTYSGSGAATATLEMVTGGLWENNIIVANSAGGLQIDDGPNATVEYNDAFSNTGFDLKATSGSVSGPSNISADPKFNNPGSGDFTLKSGSPCINAGDPIFGQDDTDGSVNDMGAFGGPFGVWTP